jgi:YggT family protein
MPLLVHIVDYAINVLMLLILVSSLLSWFSIDPRHWAIKLLTGIVDPVLHPIRTVLPATMGLDLSPLVAILILGLLRRLIYSSVL